MDKPICTKSSTNSENTNPVHAIPNKGATEPILNKLRTNNNASKCKESSAGNKDLMYASDLTSKDKPRATQSNTKSIKPICAMPKGEDGEPKQARLWSNGNRPKCKRSSTDTVGLMQARLLINVGRPKCVKSKADSKNTGPRRARPSENTDDPGQLIL